MQACRKYKSTESITKEAVCASSALGIDSLVVYIAACYKKDDIEDSLSKVGNKASLSHPSITLYI